MSATPRRSRRPSTVARGVHVAAWVGAGVGQSVYEIADYTSENTQRYGRAAGALMKSSPRKLLVAAASMSIYGERLYQDQQGECVRTFSEPDRTWNGMPGSRAIQMAARSRRCRRLSQSDLRCPRCTRWGNMTRSGCACPREEWLIAEWPAGADGPSEYWISNPPDDTELEQVTRRPRIRWKIELDY
jgi:hypothetical protein